MTILISITIITNNKIEITNIDLLLTYCLATLIIFYEIKKYLIIKNFVVIFVVFIPDIQGNNKKRIYILFVYYVNFNTYINNIDNNIKKYF